MTITTNDVRDEYTASAAQTVFNYTFKIFADGQLDVYITPSGQEADDSTDITTAYTIDPSSIGDEDGGFITLNSGTSSGDLVTIVSNIPEARTTDYQNSGDFLPDTVNADFDTVVSLVKQVEDKANRTLAFQNSLQNATALTLPAPSAGLFMVWNGSETGLENTGVPSVVVPGDLSGTLTALKSATNLTIGDFVVTTGYNANGDSGDNTYEIVAAATGTDDGGSFIDLAGSGLQAKGLFPKGFVNLKQYGVAGNGTTDETAAIQAALDSMTTSNTSILTGVFGDTYLLTAAIRIPANIQFLGNWATLKTDVSAFARGTTVGVGAVITNKNSDITNGSVIDNDVEIAYWNISTGSDNDVQSGIYLGNTDSAHVHHNRMVNQVSSDPVLAQIDIHHTNTNALVEFNHVTNSSTSLTFGMCITVRNANSLIPSTGNTVRKNYLFKNSPTATDELMFIGGGDGVINGTVIAGNVIESGNTDNTSAQLTIYPFTNAGAITTSDVLYTNVTDNHFITPNSVDIAILIGISTDVKEVRQVIIKGNKFDLDANTAIQMQSPVNHCVIDSNMANNSSASNASFCIATSAANNLGCFARVTNNTLEGDYGTAFLGNFVENNDCQQCEVFAKDARSVINNTIDQCRHNLVNDTKFGGRVSGNTVNFFNKVTLSPDVPYVFYAAADLDSDIQHNHITFSGDGFKMLFTLAVAGSAGKIAFDHNNFVKDGATDAPRMDLGSTPKELKSSNANNFYGVSTDAAPDPGSTFFIDYGVPGYIPALGKVTFFNDVAVGTAADVAQIRIVGSTLKLRADVVAS